MRFESKKTINGNVGVSYVSQAQADAEADEMDANNNYDCSDCSDCSRCSRCSRCSDCSGCSRCFYCSRCFDCSRCSDCSDCSRCSYFINNKEATTTPAQAIENLDKVREIILDKADRLNMGVWHEEDGWQNRSCAEEAICGTAHCLAGWLQVCAVDPELKTISTPLAGAIQAPIAAKMFFRDNDEVMAWLETRAYVAEYANE